MAYSTLLSLEKTINQILNHDRFSISPHAKKEIVSLDKCVISFQAFLEDFAQKSKNLEARIRDVSAEAEDILEWFLDEQIRYAYRYTKWIAILRGIKFQYQLQRIRDEMESIAIEVVEIKNSTQVEQNQLGDSVEASSSSQAADKEKINTVGFDDHLMKIKDKLCSQTQELQVIPILGMGGIGKTTLARNAYDDQLVKEHFKIRVWVSVSQDYSARRILLNLLSSIKEFDPNWRKTSMEGNSEHCNIKMVEISEEGNESPAEIFEQQNESTAGGSQSEIPEKRYESPTNIHEMSNNEIEVKVHKILSGRSFLIVMDDIWSKQVLDDVRHLFPDYSNGSRIMITTRLAEVATYANSSILPYKMDLMDPVQSWNLLCEKVLMHHDFIPRELESTGREIARSCGGLPLAIVVTAGVLSMTSKTLTSWKKVAENIKSSLVTADGHIENILSLSYYHLPHHLRSCFLYMGGFPEDHEIKVTDLIRLWIAEGFVKPTVSKEFEECAEDYMEDLVNRGLIVVTKKKSNGRIKRCSLHDMVREMCIKLSKQEKFLVHVKGGGALKLVKSLKHNRRISISHSDLNSFSSLSSSTIRTIIYFQYELGSFGSFRLLRVLDMLRVRFESRLLPDQFFELFHLKYLAFCYGDSFPRAISNLRSLQSLIYKGYRSGYISQSEISSLSQLRHLMIFGSHLVLQDHITSTLENLQTLRGVEDFDCYISNINKIPNLKTLGIEYSWNSGDLLLHNLVHLRQLENLHLQIRRDPGGIVEPNLVLPSSLKKLTLKGWGSKGPHMEIVGPFPNLEVLKLKRFYFKQQVWRTNDEDFPQLKYLLIKKSDIREWDTETSHFPKLKSLLIHHCPDLSEIPDCIGEIPTLELIDLNLCKVSLAKSAKLIQEEAESNGNDTLQVHCIDFMEFKIPSLPPPWESPRPPPPPSRPSPPKSSYKRRTSKKRPRISPTMHPLTYMLTHGGKLKYY